MQTCISISRQKRIQIHQSQAAADGQSQPDLRRPIALDRALDPPTDHINSRVGLFAH